MSRLTFKQLAAHILSMPEEAQDQQVYIDDDALTGSQRRASGGSYVSGPQRLQACDGPGDTAVPSPLVGRRAGYLEAGARADGRLRMNTRIASQVRGGLHIPVPVPSLGELLKRCLADQRQLDEWERPLPLTWRKPRATCIGGLWRVTVKYTDPRTLTTKTFDGFGPTFSDAWISMRYKLSKTECLP